MLTLRTATRCRRTKQTERGKSVTKRGEGNATSLTFTAEGLLESDRCCQLLGMHPGSRTHSTHDTRVDVVSQPQQAPATDATEAAAVLLQRMQQTQPQQAPGAIEQVLCDWLAEMGLTHCTEAFLAEDITGTLSLLALRVQMYKY